MNLFFQAFTKEDIGAIERDQSLIDEWVEGGARCVVSTDVGTAWDILNKVLAGAGIRSNRFFDDVLFNGCELVETALVQEHAARLSCWTHDKVLEGLRNLTEKDDAYHLDYFQDEEQDLIEEFDKLVAFYRQAASQGLAVIHYAA